MIGRVHCCSGAEKIQYDIGTMYNIQEVSRYLHDKLCTIRNRCAIIVIFSSTFASTSTSSIDDAPVYRRCMAIRVLVPVLGTVVQ